MVESLRKRQDSLHEDGAYNSHKEQKSVIDTTRQKFNLVAVDAQPDNGKANYPQEEAEIERSFEGLQFDKDAFCDTIREIADDMSQKYQSNRNVTLEELNSQLNHVLGTSAEPINYFQGMQTPIQQLVAFIKSYAETSYNTSFKRRRDPKALNVRKINDNTLQFFFTAA